MLTNKSQEWSLTSEIRQALHATVLRLLQFANPIRPVLVRSWLTVVSHTDHLHCDTFIGLDLVLSDRISVYRERVGEGNVEAYLKYYPIIPFERLRKTTQIFVRTAGI
jgi:hypothetical protein